MNNEELVSLLFTRLSDVAEEKKEYIFKPYFPIGSYSILNGDPGTGKTNAADGIAALVTTGKPLLGIKCDKPGNVLIFSREDGNIDHKKRITANGGDSTKVKVISEKDEALQYLAKHPLTFSSQVVEEAIKEFNPALVIFDPYQKYIGAGIDTNSANKVSAALAPVVSLAKRYDCHIMIVAHNTKAQTGLQYKFMGSVDFVGEARSAMSIVLDPERPSDCIIIHVKSNNRKGKSIRYRVESIEGDEDFAKVEWLGLEDYTERDYIEADRSRLNRKIEEATMNDSDYIVSTILRLLQENPKGIKIGKFDFQESVAEYTGQTIDISLNGIIKDYAEYLSRKHNIGIQTKGNTTLDRFIMNGKEVIPSKNKDNCILIKKNSRPPQQISMDIQTR